MIASRPIEILLVGGHSSGIELTQEVCSDAKTSNHLYIVNDGVEAVDFLKKHGQYANAPTPDVILLDLNTPRMDGNEMLDTLKNNAGLRLVPIAILTSAEAEKNVVRSYKLHANCCIGAPVDLPRFLEVLKAVEDFWLSIIKLPEGNRLEMKKEKLA